MTLFSFLFICFLLFLIGLLGIILNRFNILLVLISIELILLSINLAFIASSTFLDDLFGLLFALFVLTVAAAESSIGLALLIIYFRVRGTVSMNSYQLLKGLFLKL